MKKNNRKNLRNTAGIITAAALFSVLLLGRKSLGTVGNLESIQNPKILWQTTVMNKSVVCYSPKAEKKTTAQKGKKKKNYDNISNKKYDWYFMRNKEHKKVQGGIPADIDLSEYNGYYLNDTTKEKVIYLTFDCGYENGYTKKILKTLKKHDAKAMFFVTKGFVESNPKLVKKMKKQGHMVGNHTCSHPSLPTKSVAEIKKEIKECAKAFYKATGYKMDPYLRPPMGCYSERTLKVTKDMGYNTIFWSMAYYDYDVEKQPGREYVVNHFKENHHKGAIPLIHNTSKSNCEALDDVLTFLESKKYRFGTLDELQKKEK